jgi:hypothetical protein
MSEPMENAVARCRSCQAEIEWVLTERGKRMPVDIAPVDNGNLRVIGQAGDAGNIVPVVSYVEVGDGDRISHFATCPQSDGWRAAVIAEGRCIVCGDEASCDVDGSTWRSHADGIQRSSSLPPDPYAWAHDDGRIATVCGHHDDETVRAAYVLVERTLHEVARTDLDDLVTERA